ncbi:CapA family protein [Gilvimarinus sp. F26214L]|uniref:CapA family protein n=1 Tax=Gilvimarinus sp. DZF01 TaxID=3461371 RepID=UPI0040456503
MSEGDSVLMYCVGDVLPERDDPHTIFAKTRPVLSEADVAFCQLEANISERGTRLPQARHTTRLQRETATAIKDAGFNVVSFAGNHCMDWGREAFFDTIDALREEALGVVGVGANISEARTPLIVESKGTKIAFIAYSSILPQCYWAEADRPGCAPMRAFTHYEPIEHDQPGTPCRVHTFAHRGDLEALIADIEKARSQADVVVMSIHWGIHFVPKVIADYQREVAHVAIDHGVDLILGHHAHILKGIEVYKGKPIFYSLCNFAVDLTMTPEHAQSKGFREIQGLHPEWIPDFESRYNFPPDSRRTAVVKVEIENGGIQKVAYLPTYVDTQAVPEILSTTDPRFDEVVSYIEEITRDQELPASFRREGDSIVVEPA